MAYRKFRIALSKGWTYIVCSLSVAVLALTASCRSKKVSKTEEPAPQDMEQEQVDEFISTRGEARMAPILVLSSDSREVRDMILQTNSLKRSLSDRMNSVIYGSPEMMQRRAEENNAMRLKIDSLDFEIRKARQK